MIMPTAWSSCQVERCSLRARGVNVCVVPRSYSTSRLLVSTVDKMAAAIPEVISDDVRASHVPAPYACSTVPRIHTAHTVMEWKE